MEQSSSLEPQVEEAVNEDAGGRSEAAVYFSIKLPAWAVNVLRSEAKSLGLTEKGGRPLKGDAPGTEKGSVARLIEKYARDILMRHMQDRSSFIEHIEGTPNLLDDKGVPHPGEEHE